MKFLAICAILSGTSAYAYDAGAISCDDIGQFTTSVVEGKNNRATYKQGLAKVDKAGPKG